MNFPAVKTVLLVIKSDSDSVVQSFLFEFAKHFCSNGERILYFAPEPFTELPAAINNAEMLTDPDKLRLMLFVYAPDQTTFEDALESSANNRNPAAAVIVQNLEKYCTKESAKTVCSKLAQLAQENQVRLKRTVRLIASLKTSEPSPVIRESFRNIWEIDQKNGESVVLEHANPPVGKIAKIQFKTHDDSRRIVVDKVFEAISSKIS